MESPKNSLVGSGHQVVIFANKKKIGVARSIDVSEDFAVDAVRVIGEIMPVEHTPQSWDGTVEVDKFYIRRDVPGTGSNVEVSSEGILNIEPIDIEVIDKESKKTILIASGCVVQAKSFSISANAYIGERATFKPLRIDRKNEVADPIVPTGL